MDAVIKAAREKRAAMQKDLDALVAGAESEKRTLTDDESAKFEDLAKRLKKADKEIAGLEAEAERKAKAEAAAAKLAAGDSVVRRERMTYAPDGHSFLKDLAAIMVPQANLDREAAELRMTQHHKEVSIEARNDPKVRAMIERVARTNASTGSESRAQYETRVNPNTTYGTGGEFVPPLWLVSQYVPFVRPGRVFANRVANKPLPPGIDVINIPKITVGALTAIQPAQGTAVASQDIQTATVSAPVNTISGQEDISLQLLEQSPLAMDSVVWDDLGRDYDQRLDLQVVAGTGANGQHLGILNVSGQTSNTNIQKANAITVSSASFIASGGQYNSIVNGVNQIETLRLNSDNLAIWVHPRRANSWAFVVDGNGRPLFVKQSYAPWNAAGVAEAAPTFQGVAGELFGLPVVKDANMPTTMNGTATTGGTADAIVVLKEDDVFLFEGSMRMRALPEILSGTLQIRYQLYAYSAFLPTRFPPSISQLTGNTGLAAPTF